jgi:hypothetical protein
MKRKSQLRFLSKVVLLLVNLVKIYISSVSFNGVRLYNQNQKKKKKNWQVERGCSEGTDFVMDADKM